MSAHYNHYSRRAGMLLECGIFNPTCLTLLPWPQPICTISVSEWNSFPSLNCPYFYILTLTLDSELIDFFSKSVEPDNILGMGLFLFNVLYTCSGSCPIGSDSGLHFQFFMKEPYINHLRYFLLSSSICPQRLSHCLSHPFNPCKKLRSFPQIAISA